VYRRTRSQQQIIENLKTRIHAVLLRPGMYVGESRDFVRLNEFRDFIAAYVDALGIACGHHDGAGHMQGEVPRIDESKTNAENVAMIVAAVREIVADVPINADRSKDG
jgi:hypothetical protein